MFIHNSSTHNLSACWLLSANDLQKKSELKDGGNSGFFFFVFVLTTGYLSSIWFSLETLVKRYERAKEDRNKN